jgi:catechol 2,3-dioxygenase-like lactoylglutathione lyase family enzyme
MTALALWAPSEVADIDAARAFYGDVLGLPLVHEWRSPTGEQGAIFGVGGSGRIEVVSPVTSSPPPATAIEVATWADVDALFLRHGGTGTAPAVFPRGHYGLRTIDPAGHELLIWSERQ